MNSVLVVLISCISVCLAATAFAPADPDYPGKCMYDDMELPKGNSTIAGSCEMAICHEDGSFDLFSCGINDIPNCKQGDFVDLSLPYPDCCERKCI